MTYRIRSNADILPNILNLCRKSIFRCGNLVAIAYAVTKTLMIPCAQKKMAEIDSGHPFSEAGVEALEHVGIIDLLPGVSGLFFLAGLAESCI